MTIDWTKPVQTRDGRKVELVTAKGRGSWPVKGYIADRLELDEWSMNGSFGIGTEHPFDLINVPEPKVIGVVNIYPSGPVGGCYSARYIADSMADATREFIVTIYRQPDGSVTTEVEPCKPE